MKFRFEVTTEDIKSGVRNSRVRCPLANCLRRYFPAAFRVEVSPYEDCQSVGHYWTADVVSFGGSVSIGLKGEPGQRAERFDSAGEMEPFAFEVEI